MAITLEKKIFRICRGALYISFPLTANGNKIMGKNKSFVKRFLKTEWRNNFFSKNQIASDYWWPPEKCRGVKVWQTRDCEKYIILQCEAVYIGINLSSFWGEKPRLRSRYTVKLQDRFLRKFNIYIYIYIYIYIHTTSPGVIHNKTVTFIITKAETSILAHELDHSMLIMMTTVDKEIVPRLQRQLQENHIHPAVKLVIKVM